MRDTCKFEIAQQVYLKADNDMVGIVTGILFRPSGIEYCVSWKSLTEKWHYDIELVAEKSLDIPK